MILNNTDRYGSIAKILHIFTALLIAISYASVYVKSVFSVTSNVKHIAMQTHFSIGMTILAFTLLRIIWRTVNISPIPLLESKMERFLSKAVHFFLYIALIMMPLSGYLFTKTHTYFLGAFHIPSFKDSGLIQFIFGDSGINLFNNIVGTIAKTHKFTGKYVLWTVIGFHTFAALYHHYVIKDQTLIRILPWKSFKN